MSPVAAPRAHQPPYQPPFPPQPGVDPGTPQVRIATPMVYVEPAFEYKALSRELGSAPPLNEAELAELGKDGWELVSVVGDGRSAHFYFKRATR